MVSRPGRAPHYLVTGGAGFIGSHLVDRLTAEGARVRVLDDLSTGHRSNLARDAELLVGDVACRETLGRALAEVDGCFHLAAVASVERCNRDWAAAHRTNLSATVGLFELAAARRPQIPVVYASSAAVYGRAADLPLHEATAAQPVSAYGADKLGCELHARAGAEVHGLRSVGLRFFNVYGPRQDPSSPYSGVISIFADRIAAGAPITIFGDGEQSRDFVYVADVVEGLTRAMAGLHAAPPTRPTTGTAEVFNVCTGHATTVRELAHTLAEVAGQTPTIRYGAARQGDVRQSLGCPESARDRLGLVARTPLVEGLARLLERRA